MKYSFNLKVESSWVDLGEGGDVAVKYFVSRLNWLKENLEAGKPEEKKKHNKQVSGANMRQRWVQYSFK